MDIYPERGPTKREPVTILAAIQKINWNTLAMTQKELHNELFTVILMDPYMENKNRPKILNP